MRRLLILVIGALVAGCAASRPNPAESLSPEPVPVKIESTQRPALRAIRFTDRLHGWVRGDGFALETADGGESWTEAAPPVAAAERPVLPAGANSWCFPADGVILATEGARIIRSLDYGGSWATQFVMPGQSEGWKGEVKCGGGAAWALFTGGAAASHQSYVALRSADGGDSWEPVLSQGAPPELAGQAKEFIDAYAGPFTAVDAATAFFLGSCAPCYTIGTTSITRTADGGRTWQRHEIAFVRKVTDLSFVDAQHGWLLAHTEAGSLVLATSDGGQSWTPQFPAGAMLPARAVVMVSDRIGYGLGMRGNAGAVLKSGDGGRTWRLAAQLHPDENRLPADPFSSVLSFPTEEEGWAVTAGGRLMRTRDGGASWEEEQVPAELRPVRSVSFATPLVGCIQVASAGAADRLWSTADGGMTWAPADGPGDPAACAASAAGIEEGVAPHLPELSWPDRPLDGRVVSVSFGSGDTGCAVTLGGGFLRTADGGRTWQQPP